MKKQTVLWCLSILFSISAVIIPVGLLTFNKQWDILQLILVLLLSFTSIIASYGAIEIIFKNTTRRVKSSLVLYGNGRLSPYVSGTVENTLYTLDRLQQLYLLLEINADNAEPIFNSLIWHGLESFDALQIIHPKDAIKSHPFYTIASRAFINAYT